MYTAGAYRGSDGWGRGISIGNYCPKNLRKALLFLDFREILVKSNSNFILKYFRKLLEL